MKNFTPQTKSFIILFGIAVVGTYVSLALAGKSTDRAPQNQPARTNGGYTTTTYPDNKLIKDAIAADILPEVDISDWKTYTDSKYNFSFKYKPTWQIKPIVKAAEFDVLQIDPGKKYYNIRIFISDKGYYGINSVPTKQETINGVIALNASNMLYGIQSGKYYYTFDVGISVTTLKPDFNAMVRSVTFGQ